MQVHRFRYQPPMPAHQQGCDRIGFVLTREDTPGMPFGIELSVEDAEYLMNGLRIQIDIARGTAAPTR
jgi:hypothetical protein